MKKIVLILLITMPFFCFAQQNDTIIKNTPTKETVNKNEYFEQLSALTKKSILSSQIEPMMIFINDIPLKEGVSTMVAIEDITNIHIIIDKDSLIQYGDKAKYGITKYTVSDVNKYAQYLDIPEEKEEYETIVFAPGFESFIATQPSKSFFSEWWLKSKNTLMVTEWNYRHSNPGRYNPHIYEAAIDYDSKTDYGIDVEYTLYMFFRFMEKENNMSLIGDRQITERL